MDPLGQILHLTEGSCPLTLGQLLAVREDLKQINLRLFVPKCLPLIVSIHQKNNLSCLLIALYS